MAHHRVLAVTCIAVSLLVGVPTAETQKQVAPVSGSKLTGECQSLVVRLHLFNMASLPPAVLADAEVEASSVYLAAGVTLVWRDAFADSNRVPSSAAAVDLRVIVVSGAAEHQLIEDGHMASAVLGFAPTKPDCLCGRNAYIFSERIMTIGYRHGNPTSLLGRVIAHEVGHLLLSSNSHSRVGIMRATLDTGLSFQPRFTRQQVRALGRGLARMQADQIASSAQRGDAP